MAQGNPNPKNQFQPGQCGNPNGRPRLPEDLKVVTKLSPAVLKALIDKIAATSLEDLQSLHEAGVTNKWGLLEATVVSIWMKALREGDHNRLNFILDRSRIGRVKESLDVNLIPRVVYQTTMESDGRMVQELVKDEIGEGDIDP